MTHLSTIAIAGAKRLNVPQELELHRAAFARKPGSQLMRSRLANLMVLSDLFGEAIDLLGGQQDLSHAEFMLLIQSLLAQQTIEANREVCRVAEQAAVNAAGDEERAALLADLGKAQARLGDNAARATFELALAHDSANKDACKRLATWLLGHGDPQAVLDFTQQSAARGAAHPWHFAAQVLALASLGRYDAARQLDGRQQLGMACELPPPPDWDSIAAFNAALAAQLLVHPELQYERDGTASEKTWRIDTLNTPDAPLIPVLLDQIRQQIGRHIAGLSGFDHPWLASFPKNGTLSASCVITTSEGHETWHMHEHGSLSGVYYVTVPDDMGSFAEDGGCLAFGLPTEIVGDEAARGFGLNVVRPASGELLLFPSHCYHRTFPHCSTGRRICIAFDIWPD